MCRPYCTLDRQRFGIRMIGMLLAVSAPCVFLFFGFMPLCLKLMTCFSHWWAPTVSILGLLLLLLMVYSHLCKLSLQLIFVTLSWSTTIMLSFLELTEEDCFGHAYVKCGILVQGYQCDGYVLLFEGQSHNAILNHLKYVCKHCDQTWLPTERARGFKQLLNVSWSDIFWTSESFLIQSLVSWQEVSGHIQTLTM